MLKRKWMAFLLTGLMAVGMLLAWDVSTEGAEKIDKVTLAFANVSATGSLSDTIYLAYFKKISELSDGAIEIQYFPDAILGAELANLSSLQTGALDMGAISSTLVTLITKVGIFDFPYFITDRSQMVQLEKAGILDEIRADAEQQGIVILGFNENGFRHITNNTRPINTPEDLAGLKIRTPSNNIRLETFRVINANPTPINFSELYQALQQGVVDGQENPLSVIHASRLYEVQKYLSLSNHIYSPNYICVSKIVWDKLSPAQQAVLKEATAYLDVYGRELGAQADAETVAYLEKEGMSVNNCNIQAFQNALMPLWERFSPDVGPEFVQKSKIALGY